MLKWATGVLAWASMRVSLVRRVCIRRAHAARVPVRVVFASQSAARSVGLADMLLFIYLAAAWVGAAVAVGAAIAGVL